MFFPVHGSGTQWQWLHRHRKINCRQRPVTHCAFKTVVGVLQLSQLLVASALLKHLTCDAVSALPWRWNRWNTIGHLLGICLKLSPVAKIADHVSIVGVRGESGMSGFGWPHQGLVATGCNETLHGSLVVQERQSVVVGNLSGTNFWGWRPADHCWQVRMKDGRDCHWHLRKFVTCISASLTSDHLHGNNGTQTLARIHCNNMMRRGTGCAGIWNVPLRSCLRNFLNSWRESMEICAKAWLADQCRRRRQDRKGKRNAWICSWNCLRGSWSYFPFG